MLLLDLERNLLLLLRLLCVDWWKLLEHDASIVMQVLLLDALGFDIDVELIRVDFKGTCAFDRCLETLVTEVVALSEGGATREFLFAF